MKSLDYCEASLINKILKSFRDFHYDLTVIDGKDCGIYFLESLLSKVDPTDKKRYHRWLLSILVRNPKVSPYALFSNIYDWRSVLLEFDCVKKYLPINLRDIGQYPDLESLKNQLYAARLSGGRSSKKLMASMSIDSAMSDSPVFFEGPDIIIFKPRNIEQTILLGHGSKWRFDDRDGGLYSDLKKDGDILIWYTSVGRFLTVLPSEGKCADYMLDEHGEMVSFYEVSSGGYSFDDDNKDFVAAVLNADVAAPFYLNWSNESKIKSLILKPELIEDPEIRNFVEDMEENGNLEYSFWAKTALEIHDSYIEIIQS